MYQVEKALTTLGKKYAFANRRKDIPAQRKILGDTATIGRSARGIRSAQGGKIAADLHWNGTQPAKQEAHLEYWDSFNGQLIKNKWDGVMAHTQDSEGEWICEWANDNYSITLDQAVNNVPDWLGGTIAGNLLNSAELIVLLNSITG